MRDHAEERRLSQLNMCFGQAVLRELLRKEEAPRNVQLFIVRVARELYHLAPIEKWRRDGVERVGRTDEKDLRKIDGNVNIVVLSIIRMRAASGHVGGHTLKATFCSGSSTSSSAAEGSP
jgi:hypothetical protein